MSTAKKILYGLCAVAVLQMGAFAFLMLGGEDAAPAPDVAVFDPERSLTIFVIWSAQNLNDGDFADAIPAFEASVQQQIDHYSATTGTLIVRKDALLTSIAPAVPDATAVIMERVLTNASF